LEALGTRRLHLAVARIELEVVAAMWMVARLLEILLTASRVPGYSENPITEKIESCLII
jgi:hypothetical protein